MASSFLSCLISTTAITIAAVVIFRGHYALHLLGLRSTSLGPILLLVPFYYACRTVYRQSALHPLAKIPGPGLAAISRKWLAYYDLVHFGKLTFKIEELHKQYGPVVRIGPNELHIQDIDSYHDIFKSGTRFNVDTYIHQSAIFRGSLLSVSRTQDAKPRRDAYSPFFSKSAVRRLEPVLQDVTEQFFETLDKHIQEDRTVSLTLGFKCFALEIVTRYCFAAYADAVTVADFHHPVVEAFLNSPKVHRPKQHFPWLWTVVEQLQRHMPIALLKRLSPEALKAMAFLRNQNARIAEMMERKRASEDTVFKAVFDSLVRPSSNKKGPRLSLRELQSEAGFFIAAGMDTTSHTLEVGIWGLLTHPEAMDMVVAELMLVTGPDLEADIKLEDVEHLTYLSAVVKESLRLAHGNPGRLLRIVPEGGHTVAGYHISTGVTVGHSVYLYHTDETIFEAPHEFKPERWLVADTTQMDRHLLAFSRGSRSCIGMNLAYAELYLMFGRLLRRYEVTNAGTTAWDMEWRDFFVPYLNGSLKVSLKKRDH